MQDPAFGMWQGRTDMADTAAYVHQVRAQRVSSNLQEQAPQWLRGILGG